MVKLPLNDTVEKDDPNSFSNKIKEAIARYDEQQQQHEIQLQQQQLNKMNNNYQKQQSPQQSVGRSSSASPEYNIGSLKQNNKTVSIVSTGEQKRQSPPYQPQQQKNHSQSPYSDGDDSFRSISPEPMQDRNPKPSAPQKTDIAFSFSSLPSNNRADSLPQQQHKQQNKQEEVSHKSAAPANNSEQMLIEKDGVFTLVSKEEYTALEKKRVEEEKKKKATNNKPLVPHPPIRPKTSTDRTSRGKQIMLAKSEDKNGGRNSNMSSSYSQQQPSKRLSHSADYNSRKDRQKR